MKRQRGKVKILHAVFCRCGAAWFGEHTVDNPNIAAHVDRCGPPITETGYRLLGFRIKWPSSWTEHDRRQASEEPPV